MIGRGMIVIQKAKDQNELHFVSPWELSLASYHATQEGEMEKFQQQVLEQAKDWKPDDVVDDKELEAIRKATCSIPGEEGYHKYASDNIMVVKAY